MAFSGLRLEGQQAYGFIPTGPTVQQALAASTVTMTLAAFVSTAPNPDQVLFQASGAAAINSYATAAFGTNVTLSATIGTPVVSLQLLSQAAPSGGTAARAGGLQILSTGKSPTNVLVLGSAGTMTVWVTPGEGRA